MKRKDCRLCHSTDLRLFLRLGPQPLAGKFVKPEEAGKKETRYDLDVFFCNSCKLVQVVDVVEKDTLFSEYFYAPHSLLSPHFTEYAKELATEFALNEKSLVVEFGSNIGMMLKPLRELGVKAIGVEPAQNIAEIANKLGLETIPDFFTEKIALEVVKKLGKADMIVANNVFAHIDDLDGILRGIKALLKENGVFVFENHYLLDTVEKLQYDDIYHEHLCYYALVPLIPFFRKWGMAVFDAKRINTHGGSIRVFVSRSQTHSIQPSVKVLLEQEKKMGLDRFETFADFVERVKKNRTELTTLLKRLKSQGKKIVGYGAPARGNTLLNYCKIGTDILDYLIDDSPLRQNKFTPGTRIPIFSVEKFWNDNPDFAFLLAWGGYTEKILKKEQEFIQKGGKFILPLPKVVLRP